MSQDFTLRFNISRPVGVVDETTAQAVASATGAVIDEHCIVRSARWAALSRPVAQITVKFTAANEAEAKAISYDGLSGGVQGTGVAVDTITLSSGSGRITL